MTLAGKTNATRPEKMGAMDTEAAAMLVNHPLWEAVRALECWRLGFRAQSARRDCNFVTKLQTNRKATALSWHHPGDVEQTGRACTQENGLGAWNTSLLAVRPSVRGKGAVDSLVPRRARDDSAPPLRHGDRAADIAWVCARPRHEPESSATYIRTGGGGHRVTNRTEIAPIASSKLTRVVSGFDPACP